MWAVTQTPSRAPMASRVQPGGAIFRHLSWRPAVAVPTARAPLLCRASTSPANDAADATASPAIPTNRPNLQAVVLAAAAPFPFALPLLFSGGNGGGGRSGGGGGGGGGGNGPSSAPNEVLAALAEGGDDDQSNDEDGAAGGGSEEDGSEEEGEGSEEEDEEEEEEEEEGISESGAFFCGEVVAQGLPVGEGIPTEEDIFSTLNCQPGYQCSREELSQDIKQLYQTGLFEKVNAKALPTKKGKFKVVFDLIEKRYPEIKTFNVEGSTALPKAVVEEVRTKLEAYNDQPFAMETMALIKNTIEGWYHSRGFGLSYISHFTGMPTGDVVAHINEGRTGKVGVVYMDEDGQPKKGNKGSIPADYILKHCPVEVGSLYNVNDGRKTLQNVFALELFDNVQVLPRQSEKDLTRVEVDLMVQEKPMQTADMEAEWQVAPGDSGRPSLVSLVPGGTITYEHRNLGGKAATLAASVNTKNFLTPAEDLSYRVVYSVPYANGLDDPKRTKLSGTLFNARKMCGVFTPGPSGEDVPPVWIDRQGAKLEVTEQYSRQSRGSLGIVAQEVVTRGEDGAQVSRGSRASPYGQQIFDGPPTTLSGNGKDRMVYAQGSLVRDTTYMVNGQQLGARDVFAIDQGLGIGSKTPIFNRMVASATRFLQLKAPKDGSTAPPLTLVAHARIGNTIGDLPVYDTFLLGGPFSVRGYNIGELAACRRFAEVAVEARVPVLGKQLFAFYEAGHDLGSSQEVAGNPTTYFRRVGQGSSLGAGVKLGPMRAEAVRDNNKSKWHVLLSYGERF